MTSINTSIRGYSSIPTGIWNTASTPLGNYPSTPKTSSDAPSPTTAPNTATGGNPLALALNGKKPKPEMTAERALKRVTDIVNPLPLKETPLEREKKQAAKKAATEAAKEAEREKGKAINPKFAAVIVQVSIKGYVRVKALNNGIVFIEVPKQIYPPMPARRIILPGITTKSTPQQISQAVTSVAKPGTLLYVYSEDNRPIYNTGRGGIKFTNPAEKDFIKLAHAGDQEIIKPGQHKLSLENRAKTYASALAKGADFVECDVQLNDQGVLYMSHDHKRRRVDSEGKATGAEVDLLHGSLKEADQVADRLRDTLTRFNRLNHPNQSFAIEMKSDRSELLPVSEDYAKKMARALYNELKLQDRREDVMITSMHPVMLEEMNKLAKADGIKMNFMLILGLNRILTKLDVDNIQQNMPHVKFIGCTTHKLRLLDPMLPRINPKEMNREYIETSAQTIAYAQSKGFKVVSWNWDPTPGHTECRKSVLETKGKKFNGAITDCLSDY